MSDITDLNVERRKRAAADAEHVRKDEIGRDMYRYVLSYECDDGFWCTEIWAYSMEDAAARVESMRSSLTLHGQDA